LAGPPAPHTAGAARATPPPPRPHTIPPHPHLPAPTAAPDYPAHPTTQQHTSPTTWAVCTGLKNLHEHSLFWTRWYVVLLPWFSEMVVGRLSFTPHTHCTHTHTHTHCTLPHACACSLYPFLQHARRLPMYGLFLPAFRSRIAQYISYAVLLCLSIFSPTAWMTRWRVHTPPPVSTRFVDFGLCLRRL